MSKDKELSLQTYINSLLSNYSATGKLESHREANQIIKLLNYLTKIQKTLGDMNNMRRFEEVLNLLNDRKLIPWAEADNEKYVIRFSKIHFISTISQDGLLHHASKE